MRAAPQQENTGSDTALEKLALRSYVIPVDGVTRATARMSVRVLPKKDVGKQNDEAKRKHTKRA